MEKGDQELSDAVSIVRGPDERQELEIVKEIDVAPDDKDYSDSQTL